MLLGRDMCVGRNKVLNTFAPRQSPDTNNEFWWQHDLWGVLRLAGDEPEVVRVGNCPDPFCRQAELVDQISPHAFGHCDDALSMPVSRSHKRFGEGVLQAGVTRAQVS